MARLSDLKFIHRAYLRAYRYRRVDWAPGTTLRSLSEARLAVITTAAFHLPSQPPFDESRKGGDHSYRVLPAHVDLDSLQISHNSDAFDPTGLEQDKNLALPLDRLRSLAAKGEIGGLSERHFSFMGSISAPERLIEESAPEVAQLLHDDRVDAVFLTPV